jgi:hypothetical protein
MSTHEAIITGTPFFVQPRIPFTTPTVGQRRRALADRSEQLREQLYRLEAELHAVSSDLDQLFGRHEDETLAA